MEENIFAIAIHALLAAFGGLARQLNMMNKTPLRPVSLISGCIIASFIGVIFYFLSEHFKIDAYIGYAAAGLSGWVGPQILDTIVRQVFGKAGVKLQDEDKGKDE